MGIFELLLRIGGVEIASRGMLFFSNILLARGLAPDAFSEFIFFWSTVQFLWLLAEAGTTTYGMREVAHNKSTAVDRYREIVSIRVINAMLISSVFIIFIWSSSLWGNEEKLYATLMVSYTLFYSFYADWLARGLENVRLVTIGRLSYSSICFILALLVMSTGAIWIAYLLFPIAAMLSSGFMLYALSKHVVVRWIDLEALSLYWVHLSKSWIYALGGVLMLSVQFLPLWWIKWQCDELLIAFAPAFNLVFIIGGIMSIASLVFIPRFTSLLSVNDSTIWRSVRYFFYLAIVAGGLLTITFNHFGSEILLTIYGREYKSASECIVMFSPLIGLFSLQYVFGSVITASGQQWRYCVALAIALSAQLLFLYITNLYGEPILTSSIEASIIGIGILILGLTVATMFVVREKYVDNW